MLCFGLARAYLILCQGRSAPLGPRAGWQRGTACGNIFWRGPLSWPGTTCCLVSWSLSCHVELTPSWPTCPWRRWS